MKEQEEMTRLDIQYEDLKSKLDTMFEEMESGFEGKLKWKSDIYHRYHQGSYSMTVVNQSGQLNTRLDDGNSPVKNSDDAIVISNDDMKKVIS